VTLTRRTPLRAKPRAKGNRGELAVRNLLRDHGWRDARRNWQSGGQGGGDIINGPADVSIEVKWCETAQPWAWLRQCEAEARPTDIPVVVCRCNATPWFAILPAGEWEALDALERKQTHTLVIDPPRRLSLWKHIAEAIDHAGANAPRLRFSRHGSDTYAAVPFVELLHLLNLRENAT
jgi:hypothetical protein